MLWSGAVNAFQQHIEMIKLMDNLSVLTPGPDCLTYAFMHNKACVLMSHTENMHALTSNDMPVPFYRGRQSEKNLPGCCKYAV